MKGESKMKAVFRFLASMAGRIVRAVAGIVLIVVGLVLVQGTGGWILAIIGLFPLAAGVFDRCLFAPLFGLPFMGSALRKAVEK
jgi:Inner membrane protein YgaP-like, transmembrane domain